MLQRFRAWRERQKREQQGSDEELRNEQEAAEKGMGIDPAELDTELRRAEAAPWHRGILGRSVRPRAVQGPEAAPDEKSD
jgi:hypothetical protein